MLTIIVTEGVTLTASKSTVDTFQREKRDAEIDRELREWLATPSARESAEYSDIYKDVYGVRPRW